jgi:hypothetical protein
MTEDDLLSSLANKYASDKGTRIPNDGLHHGPRLHFTPVYHKYFESIREQPLNFLEIGIGSGPSLKMWYDYFPNAKIHAIDINDSTRYENHRVRTYIGNQEDRRSLATMMHQIGIVDAIIDDGGHMMGQQQVSLGYLFPKLKEGGIYFLEDLHTSFWPYGQFKDLYGFPLDINADRSNTTVNVIQNYIDTKVFNSPFLTAEENQYLTENIAECILYDLPETMYGPNKLAYFRKK